MLVGFVFFFSYINYSNIAAKLVRRALKPEFRIEAARREDTNIKFTPWKDGKAQSKYL
jgi:F-type H+-transporting ATPase subunit epsilon